MKEKFPKEFPKKIEIEGEEEEKEKKERYISTEEQIEKCYDGMKMIADEIEEKVCDWEGGKGSGSDESLLEREYERPINVLSAHLAAKKAQLEILERELDKEERAEKETINR